MEVSLLAFPPSICSLSFSAAEEADQPIGRPPYLPSGSTDCPCPPPSETGVLTIAARLPEAEVEDEI